MVNKEFDQHLESLHRCLCRNCKFSTKLFAPKSDARAVEGYIVSSRSQGSEVCCVFTVEHRAGVAQTLFVVCCFVMTNVHASCVLFAFAETFEQIRICCMPHCCVDASFAEGNTVRVGFVIAKCNSSTS